MLLKISTGGLMAAGLIMSVVGADFLSESALLALLTMATSFITVIVAGVILAFIRHLEQHRGLVSQDQCEQNISFLKELINSICPSKQ